MYTYRRLTEDLSYLAYSGVDVGSIGTSALKNAIPYAHVGEYHGGQVIVTGGIHARENVTSLLVMRQAFRVALSRESFEGGIYFLPMLNPDGALLIEKNLALFEGNNAQSGENHGVLDGNNGVLDGNNGQLGDRVFGGNNGVLDANNGQLGDGVFGGNNGVLDGNNGRLGDGVLGGNNRVLGGNNSARAEFLRGINGGDDFSLWKANINGVDLNNNFDARFGEGIGQKSSPAPQGYHGAHPFSEPETAALKAFTLGVKPAITLSYHALGRELYWYFFQTLNHNRDLALAKELESMLGYRRVDSDGGSTGGFKDWCIQTLKIPAFTVEIISNSRTHPLSDSDLDADWEANKNVPYLLAEMANREHN